MSKREDNLDVNDKNQGGGTPTRSSKRLKESNTVSRQRSPLRLRTGSGTSSSTTSSPRLRTTARSRTPGGKQTAPNKALLLVSSSKRKLMADYSREEKLNEYAETNLDLLLKISALKEKSMQDETQSLELMRALTAKRKYESLKEDCSPEKFIEHAHEAAMAIKQVAEKLSPASNNSLMCAAFTPRRTKLKPFNIPKNLLPSTLRVSPTDAWYRDNFPAPTHKEQFVIGCANDPKVKDNSIKKENINPTYRQPEVNLVLVMPLTTTTQV